MVDETTARDWLRLTGKRIRGCNERGGEGFESKRLPVRGVFASVETTSSVPPDFLICDRPGGR